MSLPNYLFPHPRLTQQRASFSLRRIQSRLCPIAGAPSPASQWLPRRFLSPTPSFPNSKFTISLNCKILQNSFLFLSATSRCHRHTAAAAQASVASHFESCRRLLFLFGDQRRRCPKLGERLSLPRGDLRGSVVTGQPLRTKLALYLPSSSPLC